MLESARQLHRVGALLKAGDQSVAQRPNVREPGLERFAGGFRSCRISADGENAIASLKNFGRLGVPIFKIAEQAREEISDAVQPLINTTIGRTFDYLPAHVRRQDAFDDVRISACLIKPTHGHDVFAFRLPFHPACLLSSNTGILLETKS
jgi:hypothetical protein